MRKEVYTTTGLGATNLRIAKSQNHESAKGRKREMEAVDNRSGFSSLLIHFALSSFRAFVILPFGASACRGWEPELG
jgi:hypothetical protein